MTCGSNGVLFRWVHLEAMIACIMAYRLTKEDKFRDWYLKLHHYSWERFWDKENGEVCHVPASSPFH